VQRIEVHNLEVGSALQSTLSRELERGFRVLHKDYVRFSRRLRDGVTGEPVVINSAKTRQSLRRKQRNLEQQFDGDLKFVQVINPDQTDAFVRDAAGIVAQTYQTAIGIGVRDDTAMRDYLRILAQEGTLRGYEFVGRGEPIAYVLGDVTNGTFHLWATSFLPKYSKLSPGIVLLNRVFDALTEEGATLFDFGHRDAEYKRLLGNELQQEEEVRVYGSGLVPSAAFFLDYASDSLRNIARKTLVRFGQIDRTRKVWRNYLQRSSAP
jgi:CelD/BcsL family acetyltransferase involved in cellulose biosynthesis